MSDELIWKPATELVDGYRSGAFSPVDVTRAVLDRISEKDDALNAFVLADGDSAMEAARDAQERWHRKQPAGLVDGVPVLVKDLLLTRGWPTLRGSKTVDPSGPWEEDAPTVARLREHGGVMIGKTTTPEFGWKGVTDSPLSGITRNPWDLSKTPGGSSGGASAAVAAGMGQLALGTDGGGSIRIPAGFAGIFGHKPSFGRVPAWPISPFGTVAHVGPMTRTVGDAALMMNVICEPDDRDWYSLAPDGTDYLKDLDAGVEGWRIAYSPNLGYIPDVDPEIAALVEKAARAFEDLGAHVEEVSPDIDDPGDCFRTIWWVGARTLLGRRPEVHDMLDPGLASVVEQASRLSLEDYQDAVMARAELGVRMRLFMDEYDLLLTPTLPIPAFEAGRLSPEDDPVGKWTNWTPFSFPFNLTQQPAATVPCGFTAAGLPAGLQIVGPMFDDMAVLRGARAFEQARPWAQHRPEF